MPIWRTSSVKATPEPHVRDWRLIRSETNDIHIVGFNVTESKGRVSSALTTFDPVTRTGTTSSGRRYVLRGESGWSADADYTFAVWRDVNHVANWTDVTSEVLARGLSRG